MENNCRQIPDMNTLLEMPSVKEAAEGLPRPLVRNAVRQAVRDIRTSLRSGGALPVADELENTLANAVKRAGEWKLKKVINATGIVLHTNLGRAPLGAETARRVADIAAGYSTLEYDAEAGCRGSRQALVEDALCRLTGAESAMVVNNNAAAVFLMLHALMPGKEVAVSRGELVEIGGSFRVPEIMAASTALLREVGTTNKTHPEDYENALKNGASAILKVHTSNFRMVGFSEDVSPEALRRIAGKKPLLYDLGAGFLLRPESLGIREGIYIPDAVKTADVCCFSGDKLLGAGQAGIILGKARYIRRMKKDQLARMLRVDKMTLAALEATLRLYEDPAAAKENIPVLKMLCTPEKELENRAKGLCEALSRVCPGLAFAPIPCKDQPGGGALPGLEMPGWAAAVTGIPPKELEKALRAMPVPIVGRISGSRLLLSVRTVLPEEEAEIVRAFTAFEVKQ